MRKQPRLNINFEDDYDELEVEKDDDIEIEDDIVEEYDNNETHNIIYVCGNTTYSIGGMRLERFTNDKNDGTC